MDLSLAFGPAKRTQALAMNVEGDLAKGSGRVSESVIDSRETHC